jgi:hypothetical protein
VVKLSSIDTQDASTLVCNHLECVSCGVIDRDYARSRRGHLCGTCGSPSEAGRLAFPISIHILVDLVQQAFHSTAPVGPISGPQVGGIGTVLFFCTLREALLNWFLSRHLLVQRVPERLREKLMDDNKLASQKFGDLFTSVVGERWNEAVSKASAYDEREYLAISELMRQAAAMRNEFLHEGTAWTASPDFAETCVNGLPDLVSLFVALNNVYIHALRRDL